MLLIFRPISGNQFAYLPFSYLCSSSSFLSSSLGPSSVVHSTEVGNLQGFGFSELPFWLLPRNIGSLISNKIILLIFRVFLLF